MNLILMLFIGGLMIGLTVAINALALDFIIARAYIAEFILRKFTFYFWRPLMAGTIVVSVFVVQIVHIWLWATLYLLLNCAPLQNISDALYFATVTYTTLGYGDIVLEHRFRMLGAIEGANGFILFGWTTAFIFDVISRLYKKDTESL